MWGAISRLFHKPNGKSKSLDDDSSETIMEKAETRRFKEREVETYESRIAKQRATLKWMLLKSFNGRVPENLREPFYKDNEDQEQLKPQLVHLLASAEIYCMALANIYSDPNYNSLNHTGVLQALARKGVSLADPSVTETTLIQTTPIKLSVHQVVMQGVMSVYSREVATPELVHQACHRFLPPSVHPDLAPPPHDHETALLLWINKAVQALKLRVQHQDNVSSEVVSKVGLLSEAHDLHELCDGSGLAALVAFYCPEALSAADIVVTQLPTVSDCVRNLTLVRDFCSHYLPSDIFLMQPEEVYYMRASMKHNLVVFLADLFNMLEINPAPCVTLKTPYPQTNGSPYIPPATLKKPHSAHSNDHYHDNRNGDEEFVVHRGKGVTTLSSIVGSSDMEPAGKPTNWGEHRKQSFAGRRSRRNSLSEDSQLTLENLCGSQENLHLLGRNPDKEPAVHMGRRESSARSSVLDNNSSALHTALNHSGSQIVPEAPPRRSLSRNNSFIESQRRAEETRSSTGVQQTLLEPSPPPSPTSTSHHSSTPDIKIEREKKVTSFANLPSNTTTWQSISNQATEQPADNGMNDTTTDGNSGVMGSQLLNIRMKLEEKRRRIENDKRRMEAQLNKQRQKLGKEAFLQAISKGKAAKSPESDPGKETTPEPPPKQPARPFSLQDISEVEQKWLKGDVFIEERKTPDMDNMDIESYQRSIAQMDSSLHEIQADLQRLALEQKQVGGVTPPPPLQSFASLHTSHHHFNKINYVNNIPNNQMEYVNNSGAHHTLYNNQDQRMMVGERGYSNVHSGHMEVPYGQGYQQPNTGYQQPNSGYQQRLGGEVMYQRPPMEYQPGGHQRLVEGYQRSVLYGGQQGVEPPYEVQQSAYATATRQRSVDTCYGTNDSPYHYPPAVSPAAPYPPQPYPDTRHGFHEEHRKQWQPPSPSHQHQPQYENYSPRYNEGVYGGPGNSYGSESGYGGSVSKGADGERVVERESGSITKTEFFLHEPSPSHQPSRPSWHHSYDSWHQSSPRSRKGDASDGMVVNRSGSGGGMENGGSGYRTSPASLAPTPPPRLSHAPVQPPPPDDMAPQSISFIGSGEEEVPGLSKLQITSGNRTYRVSSPTKGGYVPIAGSRQTQETREQGFYISFDDEQSPNQPKRPKPPLRTKRLSPKKERGLTQTLESSIVTKLVNTEGELVTRNEIGRLPPVVHRAVADTISSSPAQETDSPHRLPPVVHHHAQAPADQAQGLIIGHQPDPVTLDEMERKKERIYLLSLQRRQAAEDARARKEAEAARRKEEDKMRQEERLRKKEEDKRRRAIILEQHKVKKAIEEAEREGKQVDKELLNCLKNTLGGGSGGSSSSATPKMRGRGAQPPKPRPKTVHMDADITDSPVLPSSRGKKGSSSNLSALGSSRPMRRDYYRGSQDCLTETRRTNSIYQEAGGDESRGTSPGRSLARRSSYKTLSRDPSPDVRSLRRKPRYGTYQAHRKSASLMNLAGGSSVGDTECDSGLGRATRAPSPSGPGSLPLRPRFRQHQYDDAASEAGSDYSGPRLYRQPTTKSNKGIIINAIEYCVFPGAVNKEAKSRVLDEVNRCEAKHFLVLFRDSGCQFRALYTYHPDSEEVIKLYGTGPKQVTDRMFDKFFKYNSGGKCFSQVHTKHLTVTIDAFTIHNSLWQGKKVHLPNKSEMTLVI